MDENEITPVTPAEETPIEEQAEVVAPAPEAETEPAAEETKTA